MQANDREAMMPREVRNDGLDKFRRFRASRKARGMRLLRVWVPDPHAPGFRDEARRQAALLRGAPEEGEALDFIEAIAETDDHLS
jgi:antidote-toxin recognition MazE-like antitoxin